MSTTPTASPQTAPLPTAQGPDEVRVISHSNLFYWWPVWAVGFVMTLVTAFDKTLMVVVPEGTEYGTLVGDSIDLKRKTDESRVEKLNGRRAYVLPELAKDKEGKAVDDMQGAPKLHMTRRPTLGVIFCITLLIVIVITNVPLRGMWSVIVIIVIVLLSIIFALAGWWDKIFAALALLDIRINMGGYLLISIGLFAIWLFTLLFFDRQIYAVFQPGQFKICTEIGGGEKVYDTMGLTLERQRSDLFRHLILGLGSGDLIIRTTGAQAHHFDLPNVLWINSKAREIENLLRKRKVETGH
jgi:hypothetical protein